MGHLRRNIARACDPDIAANYYCSLTAEDEETIVRCLAQ